MARAGSDIADGGAGSDSIVLLDELADTAWCGTGRDRVRAEVLDELDFACERVDYGPPGNVGRLRSIRGGGRFVAIPGMPWARLDRRLLPDLLYLVKRYHVRVGDGYAPTGHEPLGEHPLGLAVDLTPGPGRQLARRGPPRPLGRAAPEPPAPAVSLGGLDGRPEPRQPPDLPPEAELPRPPAPLLGALPGRPRRPVRTVWMFEVGAGTLARGALMSAAARFPNSRRYRPLAPAQSPKAKRKAFVSPLRQRQTPLMTRPLMSLQRNPLGASNLRLIDPS